METAPVRRDAQVAVAETSDEIERFLRRLLVCETQGVRCHRLLDRVTHLRRCAKEAVGGHEPFESLVRSLEIVRLHEESDAAVAVREVGEDGAREKFVPERLPESFDLAERLRMLRAALDVLDAFATKLRLEVRRAPPRRVLSALVGEDFARSAVRRDAAAERLHHELRALVMRECIRDQVARVVVHEGRHVQALVAAEQKREDVRLPHLIRLRPLEATRRMLART
jgi:hypothetical protein